MPWLRNARVEAQPEPAMCSRSLKIFTLLLVFTGALAPRPGAAGGDPWHYTLGEIRENQQGNFCEGLDDVAELAGIFRKYGVLPGFSALSQSPNCETRVSSFIPHEIIEEVKLAKGKPTEYIIRFIRVEIYGGGLSYLVTTRHVKPAGN